MEHSGELQVRRDATLCAELRSYLRGHPLLPTSGRQGPIRGRVCMGDAAADCSAVADRPIGDAGRHLAQHLAPSELFPHVFDPGAGDTNIDAPSPAEYLRCARGNPGATRPPGARDARAVGSTWDRAIDRRPGARAAPGPAQRGHCLVQVVRPYVVEKTRPDFRHVRRLSDLSRCAITVHRPPFIRPPRRRRVVSLPKESQLTHGRRACEHRIRFSLAAGA